MSRAPFMVAARSDPIQRINAVLVCKCASHLTTSIFRRAVRFISHPHSEIGLTEHFQMARWLFDLQPVCGHPWRVGLATEKHEREAVYRLRYEVFVGEQGYGHAGIDAGPGLDVDHFDPWCDHLYIFDEERNRVAGTYRAIRGDEAIKHGGFYAGDEFDMAPLAPIAHEILQGGRACVAPEYRGTQAFQYLSYGMEVLLRMYNCKYLLGADSFRSDIDTLSQINSYVRTFCLDPDWHVQPWEANRVDGLREVPVSKSDERGLPEIIRMDIRLGFRACSPPAWDPGFRCYDLLMLGRRDRFSRLYNGVVDRIERALAAGRTSCVLRNTNHAR